MTMRGCRAQCVIKFRPMEIIINGEPRQFPAALTVAALVEALGYTGKRIAVECNGEIVARGRHGEVSLAAGDRIEIVVAVGGG
jgi:sulfur carrier protein